MSKAQWIDPATGEAPSGLGERTRSHLVHVGGRVETGGSDTVTLPDIVWIHRGRPWARLTAPLTLDAVDGAGEILAAGQGYVAGISLGAGEVTVTKGGAAALPLTPDDRPLLPTGELPWLWIARAEDGAVEAGDIEVVAAAPRCQAPSLVPGGAEVPGT